MKASVLIAGYPLIKIKLSPKQLHLIEQSKKGHIQLKFKLKIAQNKNIKKSTKNTSNHSFLPEIIKN